jgi:glycosyltransferase involved in cell wall biosynthesis
MRVTLLSLGYPPYTFGGVETYVSLLGNELSENGIETTIIAGWPKRQVSQENLGSNLRLIRLPLLDFPIRSVWFQTLNRTSILKLLEQTDLVHSNSPQTSLLDSKMRRIKPLITTMHGSIEALSAYFHAPSPSTLSAGDYFYLMEYPLIKNFYLRDLSHSDCLLHVAEHVKNEAVWYSREKGSEVASKSEVAFAGINLEQLSIEDVEEPEHNGLEMAFVGRLFYPKGATYALQALNSLVNEMGQKAAMLHIFGAGPLKNWIMHYAKSKGLQSNVAVHGQVKRDFLLRQLRRMRVAILPSLYEGCPYTVLEANALGVPVVSFDFPWSREFITNGLNGYRSQPFDTYKLAENVLKAATLNPSPIRAQARKYDIHLTAKKVIEVYWKLLEKAR